MNETAFEHTSLAPAYLIDVADYNGGKEDFCERNASVERRLHR